jgi:hypothetical protein
MRQAPNTTEGSAADETLTKHFSADSPAIESIYGQRTAYEAGLSLELLGTIGVPSKPPHAPYSAVQCNGLFWCGQNESPSEHSDGSKGGVSGTPSRGGVSKGSARKHMGPIFLQLGTAPTACAPRNVGPLTPQSLRSKSRAPRARPF